MALLTMHRCRFSAFPSSTVYSPLQTGFVCRRVTLVVFWFTDCYREARHNTGPVALSRLQVSFHCFFSKALSHLLALTIINAALCGALLFCEYQKKIVLHYIDFEERPLSIRTNRKFRKNVCGLLANIHCV